jgi:putative flavoprotein involved in K+ transport
VRSATAGKLGARSGCLGDIVIAPPVLAARHRGDLQAQPIFDRLTTTGIAWHDPPGRLDVDTIIWCTGFRPSGSS